MEQPIAKSKISKVTYAIILCVFLFFVAITIFLWVSIIDSEFYIYSANGIMACIFSCIPLSFIYFFLTAKEFLFYQDYLIFGCKIKGRTKYTYDNIDSFCYYKTRGKYGEVEILEIIINQKRNKLSYLQGVDIDALLANLKVKIPSRELFNGKEAFDIRIKKNVRTFYIVWITFLTVAFLYAIIRDQQINYDLVIVYIFIAFGLPLIVNTLTKYEEKKAKGKRH